MITDTFNFGLPTIIWLAYTVHMIMNYLKFISLLNMSLVLKLNVMIYTNLRELGVRLS